MNRREFCAGAAAAAIVAPAISLATPTPGVIGVDVVSGDVTGWWGYSINGGDWWRGCFQTRDEARHEARRYWSNHALAYKVGWCEPRPFDLPNVHEDCLNWIAGNCESQNLREMLFCSFEGANQDNDYEGEVGEALYEAEWGETIKGVCLALQSGFERLGRPDLAARVAADAHEEPITEDDALLTALDNDLALKAELNALAALFVVSGKLADVPRRIDVTKEEEVQVTA